MIVLIIGGRQSGKTTFAINEILLKRKEEFIFFSIMSELTKSCLHLCNNKSLKDRFKTQYPHSLKDRPPKNIICDNYEYFDRKFREDLFQHYVLGRIENIYLLASSNTNGYNDFGYDFSKIISQIRDLKLNDNYTSVERTNKVREMGKFGQSFFNDVVELNETIVINIKDGFITQQECDDAIKATIVHQRFKQNITK